MVDPVRVGSELTHSTLDVKEVHSSRWTRGSFQQKYGLQIMIKGVTTTVLFCITSLPGTNHYYFFYVCQPSRTDTMIDVKQLKNIEKRYY